MSSTKPTQVSFTAKLYDMYKNNLTMISTIAIVVIVLALATRYRKSFMDMYTTMTKSYDKEKVDTDDDMDTPSMNTELDEDDMVRPHRA